MHKTVTVDLAQTYDALLAALPTSPSDMARANIVGMTWQSGVRVRTLSAPACALPSKLI